MDLSNRLKRTYGSRMEVVQMDEGKTDDEAEFWKALGGRGDVKEEAAGGDDGDFEKEEDERNKLYRINEKLEVRMRCLAKCLADARRTVFALCCAPCVQSPASSHSLHSSLSLTHFTRSWRSPRRR